jgi:hypothetical protein
MAGKNAPAATFTLDEARAAWALASGLGGPSVGPVGAAGGWARTLGGIDAYLALRARDEGVTKAAVDAAVDSGGLKITPAVRGCIYLVPRDEAGLALRFSDDIAARRTARDRSKAGIDAAELPPLAEQVLGLLADSGPLTTDRVRRSLPDGAIRSLGAVGKKVGISSTLPPALRDLELSGHIERSTALGAIDTERYLWRLPVGGSVVDDAPPTPEQRRDAVVRRVLRSGGPTTLDELATYTGAGKRDLKASLVSLGALTVAIEGHSDAAFILPADLDAALGAPDSDRLSFLAFEDLFTILHGGPSAVTDARHHQIQVRAWGRGRPSTIRESKHLASRSIVRGHTLIGVWEFDPSSGSAAWAAFDDQTAAESQRIDDAAQATGSWIADQIGHGRTFSIDKDAAVQRRATALRQDGIAGAVVS